MGKVTPITEQFQHFVRDLQNSLWGDLCGKTRLGTLRIRVARAVAILTEEAVSAQTVSKLSRSLDGLVKAFREAKLADDGAYLFLDGVSLRVRRPAGRQEKLDKKHDNYRNGYRPRAINFFGLGRMGLRVPRDRKGGFASAWLPERKGQDPELEAFLAETFLAGCSTRDLARITGKH